MKAICEVLFLFAGSIAWGIAVNGFAKAHSDGGIAMCVAVMLLFCSNFIRASEDKPQ